MMKKYKNKVILVIRMAKKKNLKLRLKKDNVSSKRRKIVFKRDKIKNLWKKKKEIHKNENVSNIFNKRVRLPEIETKEKDEK